MSVTVQKIPEHPSPFCSEAGIFGNTASKALNSYGEKNVPDEGTVDPSYETFPDSGLRAWLVVCGVCSGSFGFINSWGVFQAYYEGTMLRHSSPSNIAWIGSLQYSLVLLPAVLIGRIFDLGYFRLPFFIGSMAVVVATFLIAECKEYWQFLLAQGILVGVASGLCFGPIFGILGHWFLKKRGLVLGFTALGGSVGGTIFPIATRKLIVEVGFPWTMRIFGFLMIFLLGVANLTMKRRLPPKNLAGGVFNIKALKSPAFTIYCFSILVAYLGVYSLITFIDISAVSVGISPAFAFYLVSIANACSGVGRLTCALIVDKTGAVNISAPTIVIAALITYLWPLAHSQSHFIIIAALYGFMSSGYLTTFQLPLYDLGPIEDVGRRSGMAMTFAALGAVAGPPISGAINRATGGYSAVGYYAGSMMLLSCLLSLIARHLVLRKLWGKF